MKKNNSLIFFLTSALFIGCGITDILNTSNIDSIISILIGSILSLILFFFINRISIYSEDNFFKKSINLYGNIIGNMINIILIIIFIFYYMYTLFNLNAFIQNKYLNKTPSLLIIFVFLIPVIYLSIKDYKTVIKVSYILFIISIINILITYINLFPLIDIDNLKPMFNESITSIFIGSIKYMTYFIVPSFLLVNVPNKKNYLFFTISNLKFITLFIFLIGIYGIDLCKIFYYPEFILLKKINYFNFIEHIENILSCNYIFIFFITSTMCLKFIKDYFNNKSFYLITIFISFLSTKLFNSNISSYNFITNYYIYLCIPLVLIIFLINIKIKKK